jgi:hypothetical protein
MTLNLGRGDRLADTPRIAAERTAANGDCFIYDNRMALFKSAENDYLLLGTQRRPGEHNRSEKVVGTGFEPV